MFTPDMFTPDQLKQVRAKMEEEHRRDIEALERVARFLPGSPRPVPDPPERPASTPEPSSFAPADSTLGMMERLLWRYPSRTWTIQQLKSEMEKQGYTFKAQQPIASMGVAIKKLSDRGKVTVVMRGSGRVPNVYQWKVVDTRSEEFSLEGEEQP